MFRSSVSLLLDDGLAARFQTHVQRVGPAAGAQSVLYDIVIRLRGSSTTCADSVLGRLARIVRLQTRGAEQVGSCWIRTVVVRRKLLQK